MDAVLYTRAKVPGRDSFFYRWLLIYFFGVLTGLMAARWSVAQMGQALTELGRSLFQEGHPAIWPLFWSSLGFGIFLVLLSQLSAAGLLLWLAVGAKAFCTAYVFGVCFSLQQVADLGRVPFCLIAHAALLLPAYYFLAYHCRRVSLRGRGRYWFRYRLLPILLTLAYLLLIAVLEQVLWRRW